MPDALTTSGPEVKHTRALWLLSFAFWTVAFVLNAGSEVIDVVTGDFDDRLWEPILWEGSSNYVWAVLTPFIIIFALRNRFTRENWPRLLLVYLVVMVLFSLVHVGGMVSIRKAVYWIIGDQYSFGRSPGHWGLEMTYELFKDILTYWTFVGFAYGFDYYRRYQERELRAAELQAQLAEARLENLRDQLHPHFLFNTLNTISAIMHEDVRAADVIISRLSDLLRLALDKGDRQEVSLQEELTALELYLEIMRARFQYRLKVDLQIDPEARDALVPVLILQPLVENAIKHGVGSRPEGGRVFVVVKKENGMIRLEVRDDGPGADGELDDILPRGLGLSNTVARLRQLYGDEQSSTIRKGPEGGLSVTLELPYRKADEE